MLVQLAAIRALDPQALSPADRISFDIFLFEREREARSERFPFHLLPINQFYNLANFVRACPDGAVLTLETSMLNVLPLNMMAIAMGLHVRCGIEDNIWTQDRKAKMGSVKQIEQLVRISRECGREIANGKEAKRIYRIGEFYKSADETLAKNGFAPNRKQGQRGFLQHA